jgi:hypothetical protein
MTKARAAASVLALLLAGAAFQDKPAWEEFKSVEGNFSIQLPAKPEEAKQPISEGGLKLSVVMYVSTLGEMVYLASYTDYPEGKRDPERIATAALGGFLKSIKAKATEQKKSEFAGAKGVTCTFSVPESTMTGEVRIHYVGNRLYQIVAMAVKDGYKKDDAQKSLDSFKLLDESKK